MKKYRINSIFGPTIQGEGSYTGMPCAFLRFSGCNKWSGRPEHKAKSICHFCDTNFLEFKEMTVMDIVTSVCKIKSFDLVISGGEPTLQLDKELLSELSASFDLHLETNGSVDIGELGKYIKHISMSPKQILSKTKLSQCDDIKFLYPWIHPSITPFHFKSYSSKKVFIQPIEDANWHKNQEDVIKLCQENNWNLSFQLHKLLKVL